METCYQRLASQGKRKKVALVAVIRETCPMPGKIGFTLKTISSAVKQRNDGYFHKLLIYSTRSASSLLSYERILLCVSLHALDPRLRGDDRETTLSLSSSPTRRSTLLCWFHSLDALMKIARYFQHHQYYYR